MQPAAVLLSKFRSRISRDSVVCPTLNPLAQCALQVFLACHCSLPRDFQDRSLPQGFFMVNIYSDMNKHFYLTIHTIPVKGECQPLAL